MIKTIPLSLLGVTIVKVIMPIQTNIIQHQEYTSKKVISIKADIEYFKQKENAQNNENIVQNKEIKNETQNNVQSYTTRMTSYYPEEGEKQTGSGLEPKDFEVNEHGWFTYQGKLVVATATTYLANQGWRVADGVHLRKYYDEITLNIDGVDYRAIVLDSCGSSMQTDRVDLYVSNSQYVKDTMIEVKE